MKILPRSFRRVSKLAQRRRKVFYIKCGVIAFLVIILLGLVVYGSRRPQLQIENIVVEGNQVVTKEEITQEVNKVLSGNFLFLIPRSNIFVYPQKKITETLRTTFQRIDDVKISIPSLGTLSVVVTERTPSSLWCAWVKEGVEITPCYFLNNDGLIFAQAPDYTGNVFFQFRGDIVDENPVGKQYLSQNDEFHRVVVFIDAIKKLGLSPVGLTVLNGDDSEIEMEDGSRLIFGRTQNFSELVENLKSILSTDDLKRDDSILDYIDLRFGNKVYFKFKE